MSPRRVSLIAALAVGIAAIGGAGKYLVDSGFTATKSPTVDVPKAPPVVAAATVTRRNLARKVTLVAELAPFEVDDVYAKVSGYLKNITVDYGDRVKAGQVIATLELPEEQADLSSKQDYLENFIVIFIKTMVIAIP